MNQTVANTYVQGIQSHPEPMANSNVLPGEGQNLGRIRCVVDVGENSIEIDPYVADFFFEPVFFPGHYPDMKCTAQVLGPEADKHPSLLEVDIVSKRRGLRNFALRILREELFSEPKKFSVVFGFDSERLPAPLLLEVDVEVLHAGNPIVARIHSGLPRSFDGSVSSDLSGIHSTLQSERCMTFWDWPLVHPRLEVKATESWLEHHGSIEVLSRDGDGSPWEPIALTEEFQEVDFGAVIPLLLPSDGFDFAPYHTCACLLLRIGEGGTEFPVVSHLVDSRPSNRSSFGTIGQIEDPNAWPYFLWRGHHYRLQPPREKFVIRKGRLWEGFKHLETGNLGTIKRVQHDRYTSAVPTRAKFEYRGEEFNVNWFHLDEDGWEVLFSED